MGKGAEPQGFIDAIRVVARGESLLSPVATRSLIERVLGQLRGASAHELARAEVSLESLTEREREVLALVGEGLSNDEIAGHLVISIHTVKTHVNRAMTKLDAHDRAQLVVLAYETGLLRSR
jgi:DNA-binding NarL/FixJ family response regulator